MKQIVRDYKLMDAVLKQKADSLLDLINRDVDVFSDRGMTPEKIMEFKATITAFDNFPSDETLEGMKGSATEDKNAARAKLEAKMKTVLNIAANTFEAGTGKYREFGDPYLSQQKDDELVRSAKVMTAACEKYLAQMAGEGLTLAKIDELKALRESLDKLMDEQQFKIFERDNAAHDRITAGNQLYALVIKYAGTGKSIWYGNNEAKYNDYRIYGSEIGLPENEAPV